MNLPERLEGEILGLSDDEYHARTEALSSSTIKKLLETTPLHAVSALHTNPDSEALLVGSAAHCRLLRPRDFESEFLVAPKCDRRTKAGKATWESFSAAAASTNATVITDQQMALVDALVSSVSEHERWAEIRPGLDRLEAAYFGDVQTDAGVVYGRAKLDAWGGDIAFDLKTTGSGLSDYAVTKAAADYGWPVQAAWYSAVMRAAGVTPPSRWIFGVVEKAPPHAVRFIELDPDDIELAEQAIPAAVEKWIDGLETGRWPGHEELETLAMPEWWRARMSGRAFDAEIAGL